MKQLFKNLFIDRSDDEDSDDDGDSCDDKFHGPWFDFWKLNLNQAKSNGNLKKYTRRNRLLHFLFENQGF